MKDKPYLVPIAAMTLCAAVLLLATLALHGVTERNAQAQHAAALQTLLPGSTSFTVEPYTGDDDNVLTVHRGDTGYVVETTTDGYAERITMLVGVSNNGAVPGLVVRRSHETAGLGGRILHDEVFLSQFLGLSGEAEVGRNIDAISGATVTSCLYLSSCRPLWYAQ